MSNKTKTLTVSIAVHYGLFSLSAQGPITAASTILVGLIYQSGCLSDADKSSATRAVLDFLGNYRVDRSRIIDGVANAYTLLEESGDSKLSVSYR